MANSIAPASVTSLDPPDLLGKRGSEQTGQMAARVAAGAAAAGAKGAFRT